MTPQEEMAEIDRRQEAERAEAARRKARDRKFDRLVGSGFLVSIAGAPLLAGGGTLAASGASVGLGNGLAVVGAVMCGGGVLAALALSVVQAMWEE